MAKWYVINNSNNNELRHWGILGQKWGVRRFQNKDGTLTAAGKERYGSDGMVKNSKSTKLTMQEQIQLWEQQRKSSYDNDKKVYEQTISELSKSIKPTDIFDDDYRRYITDTEYRKKWNDAADLGITALNKYRYKGALDSPIDDGDREWFLYEDQTIGMPDVANLVRNGVDINKIKNMIQSAEKAYRLPNYYDVSDDSNPIDRFVFGCGEGNYKGELEKFAEQCYEIKQKNS